MRQSSLYTWNRRLVGVRRRRPGRIGEQEHLRLWRKSNSDSSVIQRVVFSVVERNSTRLLFMGCRILPSSYLSENMWIARDGVRGLYFLVSDLLFASGWDFSRSLVRGLRQNNCAYSWQWQVSELYVLRSQVERFGRSARFCSEFSYAGNGKESDIISSDQYRLLFIIGLLILYNRSRRVASYARWNVGCDVIGQIK
jgi:hypothetical protein